MVRGFLLQNLRRESGGQGWRWQMNLQLLGDRLSDVADWPELDSAPLRGPGALAGGADSDYIGPSPRRRCGGCFPGSSWSRSKNGGHWVHADQPEVFVAALRRFLEAT